MFAACFVQLSKKQLVHSCKHNATLASNIVIINLIGACSQLHHFTWIYCAWAPVFLPCCFIKLREKKTTWRTIFLIKPNFCFRVLAERSGCRKLSMSFNPNLSPLLISLSLLSSTGGGNDCMLLYVCIYARKVQNK